MATSRRVRRVASQVVQDVGQILRSRVNDPDLDFVTITRAHVSGDLRHVRLMWAVLGGDEEIRTAQQALTRASRYIRRELGAVLQLRYTPEIEFAVDLAYLEGQAVIDTLREFDAEGFDSL